MHTSFGSVYLDRYGNNWSHTVLSQFLPLAQQHGLHYGNCLCVPVFDEIQALDLIWQATLAPLSLKAGKPNLVIIWAIIQRLPLKSKFKPPDKVLLS